MACSRSHLTALPDELVTEILLFLSWRDLLECQLTCKTLDRLSSQALIWRRLCTVEYAYWETGFDLKTRLTEPSNETDWKQVLAMRERTDQKVAQQLNVMLQSQTERFWATQNIAMHGYAAKDVLLRFCQVGDGAEDVLSRGYWSSQLIGLIERQEAFQTWARVAAGEDVPLEKALGAFELIIAEHPPETLDEISIHLSRLATSFRHECSSVLRPLDDEESEKKTALTAVCLADYLASRDQLVKLPEAGSFRQLRNALIGVVLCERSHEALPIISVAIYCCIAQRLGIDARPCAYPGKVLAIIRTSARSAPMYLDPSAGAGQNPVLQVNTLMAQLAAMGVPPAGRSRYLEPASNIDMVNRVAANLEQSLTESQEYETALAQTADSALELIQRPIMATTLHPKRARYAIAWAQLLLHDPDNEPLGFQTAFGRVARYMLDDFLMDARQLQQHSSSMPEAYMSSVNGFAVKIASEYPDATHWPLLRGAGQASLGYRVGQIFRHARFHYTGVIIGWDHQCSAGDNWIRLQGVDRLPRGRKQPFYHIVVAEDESTRYVAEENIRLFAPNEVLEMPRGLGRVAGKYFKRWDQGETCFVSNMRDQYPED